MLPIITVGGRSIDAEKGKKVVLALEDAGVDILHICGGNAQCGTCRVKIEAGAPEPISPLELRTLQMKGIPSDGGIRLSCQLRITDDLTVIPLLTVHETGTKAGPRPRD